MLAIIKTGSKQFKVSEGQEIFVEKLPLEIDQIHVFDKVLALEDNKNNIENDKNKKIILGTPFIDNAKVETKVIKHGKNKKIIVFKYKRRKKYRLKKGHRQLYTKLLITKITF
ncbi:MAG: 50S ribosomal protein L21 [Candidatus Phytoplasma stylosanthis]|uniref:50S ribosomal protein L21 n=1 Tax=Candidatus Phytoplasma stylosanthis TaxID=2798314 RepID=UPI00293B50E3|nr:50S ribosomal protein L21 [Candidatus Phytoplasma stylosanthis]MDV3168100.1 50S ribosomal protein L21 [Candidatus Phytoplasma stylosanthis]MDV3170701.1 50S ribosomal protein L21 [Candidatus Phytoplasma stylosanthis]MDV3173808.1 50S ribosomal protein L21 [Candidatus Phytoplasma stylosanthis]MDV3173958.1 50S ribosomal protein L21 [Candidatus Phytoplasma stylosanthis]MDV3202668.1 50S ribosomal protein L21 [Candidatus Phytoplasma stylosanthis]